MLGVVSGVVPFWWCRVGKVGLVDSILDGGGRGGVGVGGGVGTVKGRRDQKLFVVVGEVRASLLVLLFSLSCDIALAC